MATNFHSRIALAVAGFSMLVAAPVQKASAAFILDGLPFFRKQEVDPGIPDRLRRSFKTSRNDIVMVFDGTHWHSLSSQAVSGSTWRQRAFCEALTHSDRRLGLIPRGFRYTPGGDGRVYLMRSGPAEVVGDYSPPASVSSSAASPKPTVRRAIAPPAAKPAVQSARVKSTGGKSYRTGIGNVLMVAKGGNWEGRAPEASRGGLSAPDFCERAGATDRLKGALPYGYIYVLLADDTLVAVPRSSELARLADAR